MMFAPVSGGHLPTPWMQTPPPDADPPPDGDPTLDAGPPPPPRYDQKWGDMRPTGMHTCI